MSDEYLDPNPCPGCMAWEIEGQHACFWCVEANAEEREEMNFDHEGYDPYG